jgi:signal transduction histidine kinase
MRSIREPVDRLVFVLIPIGLASLVLAGIGGSFMSRRAMRPVRESFERQRAFIADASHELKTPLSLVKIDGEVLLRDPTVPDIQEILEHQLSEVDRMNALLSDLLTLARLDAGKLDVARKPFDLATVLVETAGRFRARATAERIDLEVRVPGKLPARGDAERTSQVLAALLDNALRFTPEGGRVTILGSPRADRVEATVTDTGPGIDPTQLARVFDRFHRADTQSAARTREGGGTGLGLAIAHDLSHAQNGELTADNGAGRGAKLKLTLPAGN